MSWIKAYAADMRSSRFDKADLSMAQLEGADFSGAQFNAARLDMANMNQCVLTGAVFTGASTQRLSLNAIKGPMPIFAETK